MLSLPLIQYVLLAAIRDRFFLSVPVAFGVGVALSMFMASATVVEQDQFAVVFIAGGLRIIGLLGLVFFTVFHIHRAVERKETAFFLTKPITRAQFLLSYATAFMVLSALIAVLLGFVIWALSAGTFSDGHMMWLVSVWAEYTIMVNVALFFALLLRSAAASAMVILGFYVLTRMMGQLLSIIDTGADAFPMSIFKHVMSAISIVLPRLDLMGQTSWLLYGVSGVDYNFICAQTISASAIILAAAYVDLKRKQF